MGLREEEVEERGRRRRKKKSTQVESLKRIKRIKGYDINRTGGRLHCPSF